MAAPIRLLYECTYLRTASRGTPTKAHWLVGATQLSSLNSVLQLVQVGKIPPAWYSPNLWVNLIMFTMCRVRLLRSAAFVSIMHLLSLSLACSSLPLPLAPQFWFNNLVMTMPFPVGLYIPTMAVGAGFGRLFGEVVYVLGLRPEPLSALFSVVGDRKSTRLNSSH